MNGEGLVRFHPFFDKATRQVAAPAPDAVARQSSDAIAAPAQRDDLRQPASHKRGRPTATPNGNETTRATSSAEPPRKQACQQSLLDTVSLKDGGKRPRRTQRRQAKRAARAAGRAGLDVDRKVLISPSESSDGVSARLATQPATPPSSQAPQLSTDSNPGAVLHGHADAHTKHIPSAPVAGVPSPETQSDLASEPCAETLPSERGPTPKTEPKRTIGVNINGKLLQPPTQPERQPSGATLTVPDKAAAIKSQPQLRRSSRTCALKSSRPYLVILRYGRNDEKRRNRICQAIEDITARLCDSVNPASVAPDSEDPLKRAATTRTAQQSGPAKPVHPFFLPKQPHSRAAAPGAATAQPEDAISDTHREACSGDGESKQAAALPTSKADQHRAVKPAPVQLVSKPRHAPDMTATAFTLLGGKPATRSSSPVHALWPWRGATHVRGGVESTGPVCHGEYMPSKGKRTRRHVPQDEDVVMCLAKSLRDIRHEIEAGRRKPVRCPAQQHWTGSEFDKIVGSRLRTLHPAVVSRRDAIATALTPYERGSCEDNSWTTKYAPSHAEEVLQNDNRAMALYDWLRALTVSAMQKHAAEAKKADRLSDAEKAKKTQKKKARRKAQDDLCGFIAHDDSEDEVPAYQQILQQMGSSDDELAISITTVPSQAIQAPLRKAMLVTGPPGCGKTAAVYAAAEELDFEVFEVNCGTRRSGKDLLERVGDMAQNHLVQLGSKLDGTPSVTVATDEVTTGTPTVDAAKQTTMASFFGVKQTAQQTQHTAGNGMARDVQAASLSSSQTSQSEAQPSTQKHKQSLILLDDVDVLFDEDKQFWSGVSALLEHSKRPIVMTCTDESLVPLDDLDLQAVLELEPAASETVADYCLAIAAQEGHLLKHADIVSLYMSCGKDLRKTLTTLNFWCQMALGSEKAGLDWRPNFRRSLASELERTDMTRTISDGTFVLGQETLDSGLMALTYDLETRSHLREDYLQQSGIGVIDWEEAELLDMDSTGRDGRYAPTIADLQKAAEARSCLDVFCGQTLTEPLHDRLDTEYPTLSTQHMSNYTEAYPVLQADPIVDFSDLTSGIGAACSVLIDELFSSKRQETECDNIMRHAMRRASHSRDAPLCRADFQSALEPLSQADPTKFYGLAGRRAMSLDREIQVMAEDVAPYVRAIVRHDEQDAKRRYEWLREEAGNNPKRRMTRVALAAAAGTDGGGGLLSRRSAYFTRHQDLVPLVLETASQSWQDALRLYMQALPPVEVVPVRPVLQREYEWVVSTQEDFEE